VRRRQRKLGEQCDAEAGSDEGPGDRDVVHLVGDIRSEPATAIVASWC
jgi:hypothetical protein